MYIHDNVQIVSSLSNVGSIESVNQKSKKVKNYKSGTEGFGVVEKEKKLSRKFNRNIK